MNVLKYLFTLDENKTTPWNDLLERLEKEKKEYEEHKEQKREKAKTYVLTISDISYVTKVGKKLEDYNHELVEGNSLENLVELGEEIKAEVIIATKITEYSESFFGESKYYIGTALIPKSQQDC